MMMNVKFTDATREIGKPKTWDDALDGDCVSLSVVDHVDLLSGMKMMRTGYRPSHEEMTALNNGGFLMLDIADIYGGVHPVISLWVSEPEG